MDAEAKSIVGNRIFALTLDGYYNELAKVRDSGKGDEMREMLLKEREKILAGELSKTLMKTDDVCSLDGDQFATLISNEDLINQMRDAQMQKNQETCTDTTNEMYYREPEFLVRGRAKDAQYKLKEYKKRPTYDPSTNTCNVHVWTYACRRKYLWDNTRCAVWYSNDDDETTTESDETYEMPKWDTPTYTSLCSQTGQNTSRPSNTSGLLGR